MELEITPEEAAERAREGAKLVDVRRDDEWAAESIAGAEHVPLDEVSGRAAEIGDGPVIFYCRGGDRSHMAAEAFRAAGRDAASIAGGLEAWKIQGLPVET